MRGTIIRLGAFVVVCGLLGVALAFTIGNVSPLRRTYSLTATFDDVTGLLKDDNVKVAGVVVGKVSGITVVKGRAQVTFKLRRDVKVPTDTEAAVRWRNLLGQRYVYLYPGKASTTLASGGRITRTRSVVDLGELFNRLGPIVSALDPDDVNQFLDTIVAALDGNEPKLRQAIDDLATLSAALGSRDEEIGRLVGNLDTVAATLASRDAEIRAILDNLLAVATTFNQNTEVVEAAATQLSSVSADLGRLLAGNRDEVGRTVHNLSLIVDVIDGKLNNLDGTVANLDEAAAHLHASSRYGEWLQQDIPCGKVGVQLPPDCIPEPDPSATSGSLAVMQLVVGVLR